MNEPVRPDEWLWLSAQLPPRAAALRVRVWRRLNAIGAVAAGTSLFVLPAREECREDFEWLLRAVREGGGEATLVQGRLLSGLDDAALRARFAAAREQEYAALAREARALARRRRAPARDADASKLRRRLAEAEQRDHFGSDAHTVAAALVAALDPPAPAKEPRAMKRKSSRSALRGRTWVTRERVHVDRIASAWLIRRWIDPEAQFRFVPSRTHAPAANELRFDMFEAEFTHEGERCTFEVLLERAKLSGDAALRRIGEIVHDIDLKDARYARAETAGVAAVVAGICRESDDDRERCARGAMLFDSLYRQFGGSA